MGNSGLNIDNSFKVETQDEHYSSISYGFAQMGEVKNDHIDETKDTVKYYEDEIRSWKLLNDIRKLYAEDRPEIRNRIVDEVAIITLKRVLPGHCDYCPA